MACPDNQLRMEGKSGVVGVRCMLASGMWQQGTELFLPLYTVTLHLDSGRRGGMDKVCM